MTLNTATGDVKFFTADGNLEAPAISDYVQLGITQNTGGGSVAVTTGSFYSGTYGAIPTTYPFDGDIYRSQVFNEIDGTTPIADFTPSSYVSGPTLVSSTTNAVWTLVGNATIFQPPVDASGPFGYLAEKASTNILVRSEDFTTTWFGQNASAVANVAVAPDGTTTMDRLVVNTATNYHNMYQFVTGLGSGTNYTVSIYMKDDGAGFGGLVIHGGNVDFIAVVVDLSTGLVTNTSVGATSGTLVASGCDDVGNGVYRVWISGSVVATNAFIMAIVSNAAVPASATGGRPVYTGVLGEDILVWGAQLELGTYPTSYIPTTTTAVTRNADKLIAGDIITDAAGSAYTEVSSIWANSPATSNYILTNGNSGRIAYVQQNSGSSGFRAYDGAYIATVTGTPSFYNAPQSLATTWGDAFTAYYNGTAGTPVAYSGTMGTGDLSIGSLSGTQHLDGTVREVKIFDSELTAEEVGDL